MANKKKMIPKASMPKGYGIDNKLMSELKKQKGKCSFISSI